MQAKIVTQQAARGWMTFTDAAELITKKLRVWTEAAITNLPNLLVAILAATVFWILARILRTIVEKALRRTSLTSPIRSLVGTTIQFFITVTGLFVALGVLGLDKTVTSLLAGVGIAGLAIGLAFQDILTNFMAGVLISFRKPFHVGELIETNDYLGTVQNINLRSTIILRPTGQLVIIPNRDVLNKPIINYSETGHRRVDIPVGISYGDDLEKAQRVTRHALEALPSRDANRPAEVLFEGFGDSSITFTARFWIDVTMQRDYLTAKSQAVMAIKRAFDENDITIPFPIRTLDFGIVGGETLTEALRPLKEVRDE